MIIREATPADAPGMARVHVDTWHTTYRRLVPDSYLDELTYAEKQSMWDRALNNPNRKSFIYIAEAETGDIVGFTAGGPIRTADDEYDGELYSIYILEACQGKGVGRQLVEALVRRMLDAGIRSMLLWVIADNPAEHFYAAMGGKKVRRQPFELGGVVLDEVGYGWHDITTILKREQSSR